MKRRRFLQMSALAPVGALIVGYMAPEPLVLQADNNEINFTVSGPGNGVVVWNQAHIDKVGQGIIDHFQRQALRQMERDLRNELLYGIKQ